jgi:hypothetical protein
MKPPHWEAVNDFFNLSRHFCQQTGVALLRRVEILWRRMGKSNSESPKVSNTMIWMLIVSVFGATTNTLLYKASLNAFSSPVSSTAFFSVSPSLINRN